MVAAPAALVLGAALLLAGGAFDSPSLYVPGVAFVLLVVGLRLWVELAARRVDLEREPGPWPIDFEIDGLRPYRHGSPASRIHWPTVARSREMVEHRLVGGVDASPLVVLDSSQPADLETLDRAVRAAASLCVHLAPLSGCALLLSGERAPREIDPQLRTWPQAHARLALVRGGGPPPATPRASGAEVVFWVTAAAEPPAAVR